MMSIPLQSWEFWAAVAVLLVVVEILTFTHFALGLAIAATGILSLTLLGVDAGLWVLPAWAGLGVLFWYGLSIWFGRRRREGVDVNDFDPRDSLSVSERHGGKTWDQPTISHDITDPGDRKPFPDWIDRTGSRDGGARGS